MFFTVRGPSVGTTTLSAIDGSANAPVNGSFKQPNFFTSYAPQNGQVYTTRPTWNVAGVDYAIGYPAASLPLKDPTLGGLPAGSSYASNVITVSGANVTLDGWDLSKANGICIAVTTAATGTFTLQNSKLVAGTGTTSTGDWLAVGTPGSTTGPNIVIQNCDLDFQGSQGLGPINRAIVNWGNGSVTFKYNRFFNCNQRMFFSSGAFLAKFNYLEGQNYNTSDHGEWCIYNAMAASGQTMTTLEWSYNTILQPANFGGGQTCPLYLSSGNPAQNFTIGTVTCNNNSCVVNRYFATGYIVGTTLHITADTSSQIGSAASGGNFELSTDSGVALGTQITSGGPGGVGTYTINTSQTVGSSGSPVTIGFLTISPAGLSSIQQDTISVANILNNYVDVRGVNPENSQKMFVNSSALGSPVVTVTGNINMITGTSIT